jgi:hypothetical protein
MSEPTEVGRYLFMVAVVWVCCYYLPKLLHRGFSLERVGLSLRRGNVAATQEVWPSLQALAPPPDGRNLFELLPDELILTILNSIPGDPDQAFKMLRSVCRHWKHLSEDRAFQRRLSLVKDYITDELLEDLLAHKTGAITSLDLGWAPDITDQSLRLIGKHCPYLRKFSICDNRRISNGGFIELSRSCRSLETVELIGTSITKEGTVHLSKHCKIKGIK